MICNRGGILFYQSSEWFFFDVYSEERINIAAFQPLANDAECFLGGLGRDLNIVLGMGQRKFKGHRAVNAALGHFLNRHDLLYIVHRHRIRVLRSLDHARDVSKKRNLPFS